MIPDDILTELQILAGLEFEAHGDEDLVLCVKYLEMIESSWGLLAMISCKS